MPLDSYLNARLEVVSTDMVVMRKWPYYCKSGTEMKLD